MSSNVPCLRFRRLGFPFGFSILNMALFWAICKAATLSFPLIGELSQLWSESDPVVLAEKIPEELLELFIEELAWGWVASCPICCDLWRKLLPQNWHWKGFKPVWIRSCWSRWDFCVNRLGQNLQAYGLSWRWILLCCWSPPRALNLFPHWEHSWHLIWRHSFLWLSI